MTFGATCLLILHHLFQGHWHFTSNTDVSIVQWDFCLFYLLFSYNPLAISQWKYQKHQIKRCKNVPVCSSIHDICCTTPFLLAWWWELQEELYESWNVACFEERDFKTSLKLASPPPLFEHTAPLACAPCWIVPYAASSFSGTMAFHFKYKCTNCTVRFLSFLFTFFL